MKKSFLLNMLGIFCGIFGVAVLGGVEITVSATLVLLLPAGLLLIAAASLLAAGLTAPVGHASHRAAHAATAAGAPVRRAA